ncbi:/ nagB_1 / Glucosamine-6-phosphate deaminase /:361573 Forward [Candidatus Hepatoplasma crinochetorum]|uniref:/ nagB_1 / Glucosamine-6-phosphate deaminase /:361573 Forward n=1 Tax=Candidatus Hepatoplasma crinochetorum TaxID=295596 RepID=A0A0G7ZL02_9MOLU|nr:/ nagB_1 / Glucosamine-6-phosphate deaminase /:361573 Forward [Candidatus Hepatoplasma crinochetorum]
MKIIRKNRTEILNLISNQIINLIKEQENPSFLIPSDQNLIDLYQKIVEKYHNKTISFVESKIFTLSEYINSEKNRIESLNQIIDNNLIKKIDLKKENFYYPKDVSSYNQLLDSIFKFNFTLLYLDNDFEISFNSIKGKLINRTKIIGLSDILIKDRFKDQKNHPQLAITLGIKDIFEKSENIYLLILGEDKKNIINKIEDKNDFFFLKLLLMHKNITILTDNL